MDTSSETTNTADGAHGGADEHHQDSVPPSPQPGSQQAERVIAPIQPPLEPGLARRSSHTTIFPPGSKPTDPTFSVLRGTVLQHTIGQPLNFVRVLMQIGYEPLSATRGKNLFGKETFYYPNVFQYMKYVYRQDGFLGFYRGFGCSLVSRAVCLYTATRVDEFLGPVENKSILEQDQTTWNRCIQKSLREIRSQSWGILLSHPFHVMAVRCMGQFVGRENVYSSINIFQNFREIYSRDGIGGFFVGLIPRWLLEVSTIILSNVLIHMLKSQLSSQKEFFSLFELAAGMIAQSLTYPLGVTSTVMIISRSGLQAATLPLTPTCANWQDAYKYLSETQQLKRGSKLFGRTAVCPAGLS